MATSPTPAPTPPGGGGTNPTLSGILRAMVSRFSSTLRLMGIGFLVLLLFIPLGMIRGVLKERMSRRDNAVREISASWGLEQTVVGPVLVVPYSTRTVVRTRKVVDGQETNIETEQTTSGSVFLLPDALAVEGAVTPSRRHRGIYNAVVYEGTLEMTGRFGRPDLEALGIPPGDLQWDAARVTVAVSDLRGTGDIFSLEMGGRAYPFRPGCLLSGFQSGVNAHLTGFSVPSGDLDFHLRMDLKGSKGLSLAPLGKTTRVHLTSPWTAPSFRGAFLPGKRTLGASGFEANWELSWYGRGYPQHGSARSGERTPYDAGDIAPSLFGVDFLAMVDGYRMVERAIKYGILFFVLLFTAYFLFETLAGLSIHPIQYLLVGAALCLFYLATLSLSEFVSFGWAYGVGAVAASLLVVLYSLSVLRSGRRTVVIAAALAAIYAYLYVVLQMQDYALLCGAAVLFVALALVMYLTRKVDWSGSRGATP